MKYGEVNKTLMSVFPMFTVDKDDFDLPYVVAGLFTQFILEAYQEDDMETYYKWLEFIETLHLGDTQMVRELATIGHLESIQNTWPQDLISINVPFNDLGEESKKCWEKLNNFWNGDMTALRDGNWAKWA